MAILIIISIREAHRKAAVDMIGESLQLVESQISQVVIMVIVVTLDTAIQDQDMDILAILDTGIQGIQVMVILVKNHFLEKNLRQIFTFILKLK